ncbi:MAG: hypothetical protein UU12_C0045G0008 [Candidatus Woesebacteria bacterium GW2011_GWA2_40_7b]|uniref:Uncharacterized protein n=1 Tax=Candidatus Woesebacteria bacterium GW2011_GWA2_40_7b TaxID=1618563 RepID=A0A0G0SX95_9BACT|nr:MAG: hypothetical protein UU12_C0045G0008 [Candidatus Woesebacteria bacterium GW2011_GWA2_40_7b]
MRVLNDLFVKSRGTSLRVELGTWAKVESEFLKIYSSLGPQEKPKILLKIETMPLTTNSASSLLVTSRGLMMMGLSLSAGLK